MYQFSTKRLLIRPLCLEDAKSIYDYAKVPEVSKFLPWSKHTSPSDSRAFIQDVLNKYSVHPLETLALTFQEKPDWVLGTVSLRKTKGFEGEIGYALGKKYQGQGLMTEAVKTLIKFGFEEFGLSRIFAWCIRENIASSRLMKQCYMTYEGTLRQSIKQNERLWDKEIYSILKEEFINSKAF